MTTSLKAQFDSLAAEPACRVTAGCKINLGLKIVGVREDGYHLLDSIFYPLRDPHDTLLLAASVRPGIQVLTETPGIDPERNTLTKAWQIFARHTGLEESVVVLLEKGIPWGAGLGGGSSDAACLLRHLAGKAAQAGHPVADNELHAMAQAVGADVPFFLYDTPMRVQGTGEILTPIDVDLAGWTLLLVMPPVQVSTPWAYRAFDEDKDRAGQRSEGSQKEGGSTADPGKFPEIAARSGQALTGLTKVCKECVPIGSPEDCGPFLGPRSINLGNDLEGVVLKAHPELARIKETLLSLGACAASMSGSGSSIYGLFASEEQAGRAAAAMEYKVQLSSLAGM